MIFYSLDDWTIQLLEGLLHLDPRKVRESNDLLHFSLTC